MEPEIIEFMPKGDVTLILVRKVIQEVDSPTLTRTSSFSSDASGLSESSSTVGKATASHDDRAGATGNFEAPQPPPEAEVEESPFFFAPDPPIGDDSLSYPPPPRARRGSDASSRRDRSTSPPASFWASLKRQQQQLGIPVVEAIADPVVIPTKRSKPKKTITLQQEVQCIVSSLHMMLASHHFMILLSGSTDEAVELRTSGHVTISLNDDPDTLIILLHIIHGKTRAVPRQVSLDLLRKLAVMVNDFGMLGSVEFFADTWIDNSKREGLPGTYNEDVLSWLFVFFVFERAEEFKDLTRLTQRECDEYFDENARDILLPSGIVDAIKLGRQNAINTTIAVIHNLITKYMDGTTHCEAGTDEDLRFACDAMLLGSLIKGSRKIGIWPRPEAPFNGQKFNELAKAIRGIKMLDVCGKSSGRRWSSYGGFEGNAHGLEDLIERELRGVEEALGGLDLKEYREEGVGSWDNFKTHILPPAPKVEAHENAIEEVADLPERPKEVLPESVPEPEIDSLVPESAGPSSRKSSQHSSQQSIIHRPRESSGKEDMPQPPQEEARNVRMRPVSIAERATSPSTPIEDPRRSYVLEGNMARLFEDEAARSIEQPVEPVEPVKKGFFAEVKSTVLSEMVQQSPTKDRFPTKTPTPVPSKEKIVYASILEPAKAASPKIVAKASVHQLAKREPTPPTSNFDFSLNQEPVKVEHKASVKNNGTKIPERGSPRESFILNSTIETNGKENVEKPSRDSITSTFSFRQAPKEEAEDFSIAGGVSVGSKGGETTEGESDVWIPPVSNGYKRRGNKKRFSVNRF